jgi:hypothetical protein
MPHLKVGNIKRHNNGETIISKRNVIYPKQEAIIFSSSFFDV